MYHDHDLRVVMCCLLYKVTRITQSNIDPCIEPQFQCKHHSSPLHPQPSPAQPSPVQPSPVSRLSALYVALGWAEMEILFITVSHAPSVGTPSISPASCQRSIYTLNIYTLNIYHLYCGGINWQYLGLLPSLVPVSLRSNCICSGFRRTLLILYILPQLYSDCDWCSGSRESDAGVF